MERQSNWILCTSKSFPGKLYYFNVLTGEAAWKLSEIENARILPKNSHLQKVHKWQSTFPEPETPPDDRFVPEPSWQRKHDPYLFGRVTTPIYGQPSIPVYPSYTEPHLPNMMQNPTQIGSAFMGETKRNSDMLNMWGYDRDSYFLNMDKTQRHMQYEKPGMFHVNHTSTPNKSQWPLGYQKYSNIPIFGQNPSNTTPIKFESRSKANIIKEPIFRGRCNQFDFSVKANEKNLFTTKSIGNSQSFDPTWPSEKAFAKYTPKSSVFQTGRIFGTKSYEDLKTHDDSGCFEMPKANSAVQKNIFMGQPERNIQITKQISNEDVCFSDNIKSSACPRKKLQSIVRGQEISTGNVCSSDNIKSSLSLSSRKRPQSVLNGQERVDDERNMNGQKDPLHEVEQEDLRYFLMAKKKKIDRPQGGTGEKIKTSYTNRNVGTSVKKRVTFDIDFQCDDEIMPDDQPENDEAFEDEQASEEAPLDIKALKRFADPQAKRDAWYIVVDAEVLLGDFEFIATFVQSDSKCRLLIPIAVRHQLEAITVGDCRGQQRVIAARQLARKIASPPNYVTVQAAEEHDADTTVSEAILNCCLQALDHQYHVVLITNDATLFKKANLRAILCFTLEEIKDGASAPMPEISFNIKKIINSDVNNDVGKKDQCFTISSTVNPFSLKSKNEIPVNCFKKRLFDEQNIENTKDEGLFFRNDETSVVFDSWEIPKTNKNTKRFADRENFQSNEVFAPKNYRDCVKDQSDTSANTNNSEIRQIQENIQNLNIKDVSRNIILQKVRRLAQPNQSKEISKIAEKNVKVLHKNEARTEERKETKNKKLTTSINAYTIEQHLKQFDIKTEVVEDRIKTRMDEWICSFSQIMEDVLTYILQDCCSTQSSLPPPWTLAEAVECVRNLYGDHSSVKVIVDKMSALLFNSSCKRGELSVAMKPKDFMAIFGLGILLIQCLKNVIPRQCELHKAEEALLSLLRLVTEPAVEPAPPQPAYAPSTCASAEPAERKNFIKKPSEVIEYLKIHYPKWKSYTETREGAGLHQEMHQLKEKGERSQIVRTLGKNLCRLNIDNNKAIFINKTINSKPSTDKNEHSNDAQKAKKAKVNDTKFNEIKTQNASGAASKTTGAKLLRELAINSLHKMPTLQNIDVENRDKSGKELLNMIDSMIGKPNEDATEHKIADVNDRNNNTNQVNCAIADHEPKFVRKFINFTIKKMNWNCNDDKNKMPSTNDAPKKNLTDIKHAKPKIIRNFNVRSPPIDKNYKSNERLDLEALDYEMDEEGDTSQMTIVNDEKHDDADAMGDDVAKNREDNQTDDETPQNEDGIGGEQSNENIENDTTNDSGFENDSLHAYAVAKMCLAEISETLKMVYNFISIAVAKFQKGRFDSDSKMAFYQKSSDILKILAHIIDNLKRIVKRESGERTSILAALMKEGGAGAFGDKRIMRYKQVILKCLEQAGILQEALRVVLAATAPAGTVSVVSVSTVSSHTDDVLEYINIFEP